MKLFLKLRNWFTVQKRIARAEKLLYAMTDEVQADNIDLAIAQYEEAYAIATQHHFRYAPEEICFHLGIAYAIRINGEPAQNQNKAFQFLRQVLQEQDFHTQQLRIAFDLLHRADRLAYHGRRDESRPKKAIKAFEKAISYGLIAARLFENLNLRREWASIQAFLSWYYLTLNEAQVNQGKPERETTRRAIHHAEQARRFFQGIPQAKEMKFVNLLLGLLYWLRNEGNPNENSERAAQFLEPLSRDPEFSNHVGMAAFVNSLLIEVQFRRTEITYGEKIERVNEHLKRLSQFDLSGTPLTSSTLVAERIISTMMYHSGFLRAFENDMNFEQMNRFYQTVVDTVSEMDLQDQGFSSSVFRFQKDLPQHLEEAMNRLSETEGEVFWRHIANREIPEAIRMMRKHDPLYLKPIQNEFEQALARLMHEFEAALPKATHIEQSFYHLQITAMYVGLINFPAAPGVEEDNYSRLALRHFKEAFNLFLHGSPIFSITDCAMTFGIDLLFKGKFWDEAEMVFRYALESQEELYQRSVTEKGRQFILKETGYAKFSLILPYAYVLAWQGKTVEAVEVLEKWRGRQLSETLQSSTEAALLTAEADDRRAYLETVSEITHLEKQSRGATSTDAYDDGRKLELLRAQLEKIIARIRSYIPDFLSAPSYAEIQKAASANKPIIYLLVTDLGSLALVVPAKGDPISIFIDDFTQGSLLCLLYDSGTWAKLGRREYSIQKKLTAEIIPELARNFTTPLTNLLRQQAATGAYLIPCGSMSVMPLHAAADAAGDCLIDHFDIHFVPTAQSLAAVRQSLPLTSPEPYKLLALGDPRNDLAFATAETESLKRFFRSPHVACALIKEAATFDNLKENLQAVTHLHFACHGMFEVENPLDSALLLARGQILTLKSVLNEPAFAAVAKARLVVLSACQTALSDYSQLPEEAIGFPAGFLRIGVPGVVGTLWPVDDLSTALLIVRFYDNLLKANLQPATALRKAQTWLRDATRKDLFAFCQEFSSLGAHAGTFRPRDADRKDRIQRQLSDQPYQDPFYWASFVLVGL